MEMRKSYKLKSKSAVAEYTEKYSNREADKKFWLTKV